ncbi:MAG: DUF503 domain-containing protein [Tissierellaceae bacterium]|jgi:uncharacterized protein YlxP (DUF503 family)|nr:DUF503 domain-containing protein [Tissierellia bacterium]
MVIGACEIKLQIYEANSLKEKRHTVKSLIGRLKSRFNISIAEIGLYDSWQTSIIGFACVTNDSQHANEIISKVLKFVDGDSRLEILDYNIEIL